MIFGFQFKKASRSQGEKNQLLIAPRASIQPPGTILSILSHHISPHGSVVTSLDQQLHPLPAPHCIPHATCSCSTAFPTGCSLPPTSLTLPSSEQVPPSPPQATSSPASGMLFSTMTISSFPFPVNALPLPLAASGQQSPPHSLLPAHLLSFHHQLLLLLLPGGQH